MAPKAMSIKHLFGLRVIREIRLAPGGERAAVVVQSANEEKQRNETRLLVWRAEDDALEPLTNGPADAMPRWISPTELLFTGREREDDAAEKEPFPPTRVYTISLRGGEARLVGELPGSVGGMEPSPKGDRLAMIYTPHPKAKKSDLAAWKLAPPPHVARHRSHKLDGAGMLPEVLAGVWTVALRGDSLGKPKALVTSDTHRASALAWTPDGSRLVVLQNDANDDHRRTRGVLASMPTGATRALAVPEGPVTAMAVSPDGKRLALAGSTDSRRGSYLSKPLGILSLEDEDAQVEWIAQTDGAFGTSITLSDVVPAFTSAMRWDEEGAITTLHSHHGRTELVRVEAATGKHEVLAGQVGVVWAFDARDGVVLHGHAEPTQPGELFRLGRPGAVSRLNARVAPAFNIQPRRWFTESEPGTRVDTYLWATEKQATAKKAKSLPLVLYVHGGPIVQTGDAPFHEYAWLAGEGFPVVAPNPRGSTGYGDEHGAAIFGNWGDRDAHDLLAVVDETLARHPQLDPARVYCVGGSYGGYMTLWMLTRHPGRFAGGVAQRCLSNYVSMVGTSDLHNGLSESAIGRASAFEDPAHAWERSPISRVADITAPLLLIHPDNDLRCPLGQAEEVFNALATMGRVIDKDVRLVVFRGETHELSRGGKPANRRRRLEEILGWLRRCDQNR